MSSTAKRLGMLAAGYATRDAYKYGKRLVTGAKSRKNTRAVIYRSPRNPGGRSLTALKRFQDTVNVTSRKLHALHYNECTNIPSGTDINDRERQQIFIRGLKLNFHAIVDTSLTTDLAVRHGAVMRVVVAQQRHADTVNHGQSEVEAQLFKGMGISSVTNFDAHSNGLNSITLPINTRKWKVFFDRKYHLVQTSGYAGPDRHSYVFQEQWIPINQKAYYNGTLPGYCENPIMVLWWYENPQWSAAGESTTAPIQDRFVCNLYFNDVL